MAYRPSKHMSLALLLGMLALMAATTSHVYVRAQRPEPRDPQVAIEPHRDYRIESVSANKCVRITDAPPDGEGDAQLWTCDDSAAQRFRFDPLAEGFYGIRLSGSNRCLHVAGGSRDNGAALRGATWTGDLHQHWQVLGVGADAVRLEARHSEKVIDVWLEKTTDGAELKQMFWKGSRNQQFRLRLVESADR